ncbi:MAG: DivIVA domain-containing protein [Coriobacteriia bacterium]
MKLTPLDIHHKEFRHSIRGYHEEEVDQFLDQVADEFERLFKENIELAERIEAASAVVKSYEDMKETLNNTLLQAQRSAEEIIAKAQKEADLVLRDAEVKAKEVIHQALSDKQKASAELLRIKQAEEEFRGRFKSLLDQHLRSIGEIGLPEDVMLLTAESGGETLVEAQVAPETVARIVEEQPLVTEPVPVPAPAPAAVVPEPIQVPEPADDALDVASVFGDEPVATVAEPLFEDVPASGFVTSLQLGEITPPDLGPEEPTFSEPEEFVMPSFGSLGERDDDVEIEEID